MEDSQDPQDPQPDRIPASPQGLNHQEVVKDIDAHGAIDLDPHGKEPLGSCYILSIAALQAYRPEFTHALLSDNDIRVGRDFIVLFRGTVTRGHVC